MGVAVGIQIIMMTVIETEMKTGPRTDLETGINTQIQILMEPCVTRSYFRTFKEKSVFYLCTNLIF